MFIFDRYLFWSSESSHLLRWQFIMFIFITLDIYTNLGNLYLEHLQYIPYQHGILEYQSCQPPT
jgi:hypothetical protein